MKTPCLCDRCKTPNGPSIACRIWARFGQLDGPVNLAPAVVHHNRHCDPSSASQCHPNRPSMSRPYTGIGKRFPRGGAAADISQSVHITIDYWRTFYNISVFGDFERLQWARLVATKEATVPMAAGMRMNVFDVIRVMVD